MQLDELHEWILSDSGLGSDFAQLARLAAARSAGLSELPLDLSSYEPDWRRLIFAGSVLAKGRQPKYSEAALMAAHAGLLYSDTPEVRDASAVLLTQLSNHRAVRLAETKGALPEGLQERLGAVSAMLAVRRDLAQSVFVAKGDTIQTNSFQRQFWDELEAADWVSASAPTASGKTYLILRWLLNQFVVKSARLAVFIAPTRALVGEIERELLDLSGSHQIEGLRIASLPIASLGDLTRPTILVFTQERLHVFLNAVEYVPPIDIAVIDEVHKLGDTLRGVILQDAIERIARSKHDVRLIFLSPLTKNPEMVLSDAPKDLRTAVVPSDTSTVTQNLLIAQQAPRDSRRWLLSLKREGATEKVGVITLHARPDTQTKRLSYVALALGRGQSGTLIYANGAAEAEKLAWQIFNAVDDDFPKGHEVDPEIKELSEFARETIHPRFSLVEVLQRGIGFHYGNMPTLLRGEIERLFRDSKIKFLVCTSTLVEGVNLACRTIVVRGPRKGNGNPMGAHDFWNLAGRAGRWGHDFHGNIVCVDVDKPKLWPEGAPERARYPICRETEKVLGDQATMLDYLEERAGLSTADLDARLEQVLAYLMSVRAQTGSFLDAPVALRLDPAYREEVERRLAALMAEIDVPVDIIARHPGVSAMSLQSLLNYFRTRKKPVEQLLPSAPDSEDSYERLIAALQRIHMHMFPAFPGSVALQALVTIEWMKGFPLGRIIQNRIKHFEDRDRAYKISDLIRATMRDVEEVARFKAPKYLSAYLDVLRFHLESIGQAELFPEDLRFDLYLEFGVATQTLLSLIGIGLSRTGAVALNEFLGNDALDEPAVLEQLATERWQQYEMPEIVKREIREVLRRRADIAA